MAMRFVSTEVISSTDGISHSETKVLDSEEIAKARREQQLASGNTLYDQLQAQEAKTQEAYDENTKRIFAPREALDEEDILFFEEQRKKARRANEERDRAELDSFAAARRSLTTAVDEAAPAAVVPDKKRPPPANDKPAPKAAPKLKRKLKTTKPASTEPKPAQVEAPATTTKSPQQAGSKGALGALAYGSDSDSE